MDAREGREQSEGEAGSSPPRVGGVPPVGILSGHPRPLSGASVPETPLSRGARGPSRPHLLCLEVSCLEAASLVTGRAFVGCWARPSPLGLCQDWIC